MIPSSLSVEVTHNTTLTTTVSGVGVENFMYQWRHNGTIIVDEINDTLIITDVMTNDTGEYECIVTNEYGDSDVSSAPLTVTGMIYPYRIILHIQHGVQLYDDIYWCFQYVVVVSFRVL